MLVGSSYIAVAVVNRQPHSRVLQLLRKCDQWKNVCRSQFPERRFVSLVSDANGRQVLACRYNWHLLISTFAHKNSFHNYKICLKKDDKRRSVRRTSWQLRFLCRIINDADPILEQTARRIRYKPTIIFGFHALGDKRETFAAWLNRPINFVDKKLEEWWNHEDCGK